uniref:Uncharacterized protein n=1 Tax=Guillardia theta TaxID=55529 RepID=A0A7S4KQJ5_GUITH|mmetsp:Transcript_29131/g.93685  ORF Transcript_29131/g.93685 Transcript_29131/m.93685 type:complete len:194 (+) Transcript_29131:389-970(+)
MSSDSPWRVSERMGMLFGDEDDTMSVWQFAKRLMKEERGTMREVERLSTFLNIDVKRLVLLVMQLSVRVTEGGGGGGQELLVAVRFKLPPSLFSLATKFETKWIQVFDTKLDNSLLSRNKIFSSFAICRNSSKQDNIEIVETRARRKEDGSFLIFQVRRFLLGRERILCSFHLMTSQPTNEQVAVTQSFIRVE